MPAPEQMFTHGLDVKKGWFDMASLDFAAKLSSDVDFVVKRGRVVYVNAAGEFVPGVHQTNVAIFLLNGSEDADVNNPGWNTPQTRANFMHIAVAPTGKMSGLVATGGYEISSTEFDTEQDYAPGDLLSATATDTPAVTDGVLTNENVEQYDTPVVGVVSSGVATNHNGVDALSFWSVWLPGSTDWEPASAG